MPPPPIGAIKQQSQQVELELELIQPHMAQKPVQQSQQVHPLSFPE